MGQSIYAHRPDSVHVRVCVPYIFHYVHFGTYLGLWRGYGVRICFVWSLSVSLYSKKREGETEKILGPPELFLINDFDNLLPWFRFFALSMVFFCPRGGTVLQLDG
jgi:hypothetical protein